MPTLKLFLIAILLMGTNGSWGATEPTRSERCQEYLTVGSLSQLAQFLVDRTDRAEPQTVFVEVPGKPLSINRLNAKLEQYGGKISLVQGALFLLKLEGTAHQLLPTLIEVQSHFGPGLTWVEHDPLPKVDVAQVEQDFVERNYTERIAPDVVMTRDSPYFEKRFAALEAQGAKFPQKEWEDLSSVGHLIEFIPLRVRIGDRGFYLVPRHLFEAARALRNRDLVASGALPRRE